MKKTICSLILILSCGLVWSQQYHRPVKPVKNVIVMIPDGTSIGVVSAARWYQIYNKLGGENLNIDPYVCGTVKTFSSNAPIGDSAPTTSAYMTGMPQRTGNVAIYPVADPENDLVKVDPSMAYQPLVTILEAAKIQKKKAVGMVVTVEFPHATPADCSSHYYARGKYEYIAPQIAYNNLDVMFGGGNSIVTDDMKNHFKKNNTTLIQDDINAFRSFDGDNKVWALFQEKELPYDLDRDDSKIPSLEEMTRKAIDHLSENDNGFFLMVEGSKVDWVAHGNDAVGCITEYLAFDKAVGAAIEFAKKDGETAVVILPDHGNSGFTIGRRDLKSYDKATIHDLFANVSKYKRTGEGLERILLQEKPEDFKAVFKKYTDIDLTEDELASLLSSKNYKEADYMKKAESQNMGHAIVDIMNSRTYFGFTTGGHTGEEVFLAAYHPQGDVPLGMNTNIQINNYLSDVLGLEESLPEMTKEVFAKHQEVFKGLKCTIDKSTAFPQLTVRKGKKTLVVPAFKSIAYVNGKEIDLGSVTVYIDKNDTFYLPSNLIEQLN
ncbi:alkaline phosphatase [Dysgonomonas sp. HGC4]|uniref:alkaline phosphatase n=1 Tax=Dysgonomonas sp. HGC4 TaxID=1658009 RepID=UPI000680CA4F|nr:alkaline phosphatase [Dysgonomonas sp. HGC4]MBD8349589.1 alkaline phosphatase [Dysgonomonas sp. HGC4]